MKGSSSMKKMNNRKGFTLAELLIVVAIIAVLVAVAIPVFTNQLEKSREATDIANVRSAYAVLVTNYLTDNTISTYSVVARQTVSGWQGPSGLIEYFSGTSTSAYNYEPVMAGHNYKVKVSVNASTGDATPEVTSN